MAFGGDAGLSGGSGNLTLALWNGLAASGCHFAGHDLHLHDLNCESLGTHITVTVGDSTCNGHAWVLATFANYFTKIQAEICFMHNLRYAKYEHFVCYK